jgi:hypothetical protein
VGDHWLREADLAFIFDEEEPELEEEVWTWEWDDSIVVFHVNF